MKNLKAAQHVLKLYSQGKLGEEERERLEEIVADGLTETFCENEVFLSVLKRRQNDRGWRALNEWSIRK
jgi:hypothetical protein